MTAFDAGDAGEAPSGKTLSSSGGEVSGDVMGGPDKFEAVVAADGVP